jgi:hypothetical protein
MPVPNMNTGAFNFAEWLTRIVRGSPQSMFDPVVLDNPRVTPVARPPATTALPGLGAAIAAALAAAGD